MLPRSALTFLLALFLCPASALAQSIPVSDRDSDGVAPAHVSFVEGTVVLERDGKPEGSPLNMPLLSGDRLKTQDGRVEVLFADGSALHLDSRTTLDIQSDDLARLIDGRVRLSIGGPSRAVAYRIDSPAGSVRISETGEYRVSMLHGENETQVELAVIRGSGEIFTDEGTTPVRAGERAYASAGLAPSYAYTYNSANWDAFDRWSESRRDTRLGVSAQYLPEDVRPYSSTFDEYGSWQNEPTYGQVWYPRVAAGWRPYYYGRWASYPRYGWTWIGADAFAWPTHHYGRWGFSAGAWFWIPSAHWAPAYVSWAYAPGYVSWCPLGFNNRPVISANIFSVGPRYYSSAYAWTAVPYAQFGHGYYVHQRAVNWNTWDRRTTWQAGRGAPTGRDIAVPRGSTTAVPIRWAGRADVGRRASDIAVPRAGVVTPRTSDVGRRTSDLGPRTSDLGPRTSDAAAPRYVNRGDQIIRSQTERPSPPGRAPGEMAVPRSTAPAQRIDVAPQMGITSPRNDVRAGAITGERAVPRGYGQRVDSPAYAPGYAAPTYRVPAAPSTGQPDMRYGRTQPGVRAEEPRGDAPIYRARPLERSGGETGAPAGVREFGRAPERAQPRAEQPRPSAGSSAPSAPPAPPAAAPPPNSGFRQAPAAERAAPSSGGGSEGRAAPRSAPAQGNSGGSVQARPRGGRGGGA